METDWLFWIVAFAFFLPMHIGMPLLYLLVEDGPEGVRRQLPWLLLRGTVSALVAFAIALAVWPYSKLAAGAVIAIAFLYPWLELVWRRSRAKEQ